MNLWTADIAFSGLNRALADAFLGFRFSSFIPHPSSFRRRRGQNTVEYLLMLGVVASMAVIMVIMFHKKILGGIFTLAGLIIGAGTPK